MTFRRLRTFISAFIFLVTPVIVVLCSFHWRHTFMTFFSIAPGMMISFPRSFARTPIEE